MHDYLEFAHPLVRTYKVKARDGSNEITQACNGLTLRMAYGWTLGQSNEQAWVVYDSQIDKVYQTYILSGDLVEPS